MREKTPDMQIEDEDLKDVLRVCRYCTLPRCEFYGYNPCPVPQKFSLSSGMLGEDLKWLMKAKEVFNYFDYSPKEGK